MEPLVVEYTDPLYYENHRQEANKDAATPAPLVPSTELRVRVAIHYPSSPSVPYILHMGNLPDTVTASDLFEILSHYGSVTGVNMSHFLTPTGNQIDAEVHITGPPEFQNAASSHILAWSQSGMHL